MARLISHVVLAIVVVCVVTVLVLDFTGQVLLARKIGWMIVAAVMVYFFLDWLRENR